jgi:alpha-ketoglutarate-dependent taurine dioxygenase
VGNQAPRAPLDDNPVHDEDEVGRKEQAHANEKEGEQMHPSSGVRWAAHADQPESASWVAPERVSKTIEVSAGALHVAWYDFRNSVTATNEALDVFYALCADPRFCLKIPFRPGDIQYLQNHVVFHGRTAYQDHPPPRPKRHLMRIWLSAADGRERHSGRLFLKFTSPRHSVTEPNEFICSR